MSPLEDMVLAVARRLSTARHVAVVTGAGISAESGIRTFRDTMEGLWKEFDPQKLATQEAFDADPELVTRWYDWRRLGCLGAEPNAGHRALAELERRQRDRGAAFVLLTQNVDGLHQRAGSQRVVEVHGSIHAWRCTKTGREARPGPEAFTAFPPPSPWGGLLRPGVVWFGESLPLAALREADHAIGHADVFLSVGTSAVVYPAAGFIEAAAGNGALTVEVNKDPTPISRRVDFSMRGSAGEILPRILDAMTATPSPGQE